MLHWTHYRWTEMEKKVGFSPLVSMGPGYSEWEQESEEEELKWDDCQIHSISKRMVNYCYKFGPHSPDHNMDEAEQEVLSILHSDHIEWIKLSEYELCLAKASQYDVDPNELYAGVLLMIDESQP